MGQHSNAEPHQLDPSVPLSNHGYPILETESGLGMGKRYTSDHIGGNLVGRFWNKFFSSIIKGDTQEFTGFRFVCGDKRTIEAILRPCVKNKGNMLKILLQKDLEGILSF